MPKVLINKMEKDNPVFEIDVTEKEAAIVRSYWVAGAEVIIIGGRPWNTKYIIGISDGGNKVRSTLKIDARKPDQNNIKEEISKVWKHLEEKGLGKKKVNQELDLDKKEEKELKVEEDENKKVDVKDIPF